MKVRLISALAIFLIFIPIFYIGGIPFNISFYLITIFAFREFIKARDKKTPDFMKLISYLMITFVYFETALSEELEFVINYRLLAGLFLTMLLPVVLYRNEKTYNVKDAFYLLGGLLFLGFSIPLFGMYRNLGLRVIVYLLSITITSDTFAYITGKLIGTHKLLVSISPNKTLEGLVGGVLMGTFMGTMFFITVISPTINIFEIVGITLFLCIVGNMGDLLFSAVKRTYDIKDFSNIVPGHGGILDRIDSIIFVMLAFTFFTGIL